MKKYRVLGLISEGRYSTVLKAASTSTGEIVAIKKKRRRFSSWPDCLKLREVQCLINLRKGDFYHSNVVLLKSIFREYNELHFVYEFVESDMYQVMLQRKRDRRSFREDEIRDLMLQTFKGLEFIHKKGVFHRDMKPENLLMRETEESKFVVKISDFGLAREIRSRPPFTEYVSTRWYRAPEVLLKSHSYSSPIDVFACGCIMAELYLMHPLFPGKSETDQFFKYCNVLGTPSKEWAHGLRLAKKINLSVPAPNGVPIRRLLPDASFDAVEVIEACLRWNPRHRPTCSQILKFPFFLLDPVSVQMEEERIGFLSSSVEVYARIVVRSMDRRRSFNAFRLLLTEEY